MQYPLMSSVFFFFFLFFLFCFVCVCVCVFFFFFQNPCIGPFKDVNSAILVVFLNLREFGLVYLHLLIQQKFLCLMQTVQKLIRRSVTAPDQDLYVCLSPN